MKKGIIDHNTWTACTYCQGRGKKSQRIRKKAKLSYKKAVDQFEKTKIGVAPLPPKGHLASCSICEGTGLQAVTEVPIPDIINYPKVAIIGGGIGGIALAIACLHRGIPFTLYERDKTFNARSQGYGLTLQQASKAIQGLGILDLKEGIVSTRHLVHKTDGTIIGEWGMRKWLESATKKPPKRTNIHIARQQLRMELLEQLGGPEMVQWDHQFLDYKEKEGEALTLHFKVDGEPKSTKADLVVGADGIRSTLRNLVIGEKQTPLQYLGCIVILGICPLSALEGLEHSLLDGKTVFQTVNGIERMYMMPYDSNSVMWQFSFPISEEKAKALSSKGPQSLKEEACKRTQWHTPIPQIMEATQATQITGYPVYDRAILTSELLKNTGSITLIGDAAHPMSPFKGQGANQAILDALALASGISKGCRSKVNWNKTGIRTSVLNTFENEMIKRTTIKVKDSAAAVRHLHSNIVLQESDAPRGRIIKD